MIALRLVGAGIGFALAVLAWPLTLALAVGLLLLAGLSRWPAPAASQPEPKPPAEPLLADLRLRELAKVAERNREHLEICYLTSERD